MKARIKLILLIYPIFFMILFVFTSYADTRIKVGINADFIPGLTLVSPTTDDISLTGKDYLEFKWERSGIPATDHYDFRIYKGHDTTEANLIFKKDFPINTYPIQVGASLFSENQVYTWMLMQVFYNGRKSDRSYSSFKIISKPL